MKRLQLLLMLSVLCTLSFSQKVYESSVTNKYQSDGEVVQKSRSITLSDDAVEITNYLGGTGTLILSINNTIEKEYGWDGLCKWLYCTSKTKDSISGEFTEYVIIIGKSYPSNLKLFQKVDEVTYLRTDFSLM